MKVQTIKVGPVAISVPPGAFVTHGTVARVFVIVTIFAGKRSASMITKRIYSSA